MNQLTIRKIPAPIEQKLRLAARRSGKSINKTVVEVLGKGLGISQEKQPKQKRDVAAVFHQWSAKELGEFEKNTEPFGSIDGEMWRE